MKQIWLTTEVAHKCMYPLTHIGNHILTQTQNYHNSSRLKEETSDSVHAFSTHNMIKIMYSMRLDAGFHVH